MLRRRNNYLWIKKDKIVQILPRNVFSLSRWITLRHPVCMYVQGVPRVFSIESWTNRSWKIEQLVKMTHVQRNCWIFCKSKKEKRDFFLFFFCFFHQSFISNSVRNAANLLKPTNILVDKYQYPLGNVWNSYIRYFMRNWCTLKAHVYTPWRLRGCNKLLS